MASLVFDKAPYYFSSGVVDLDSDSFFVALIGDGWTPDSNEEDWNEVGITAKVYELANGNGYTTGGNILTKTLSEAAGTTTWDAVDVSWTSATFTARYAVVYDNTTSPKKVILMFDFGVNKTVTAGTFTLTINASGMMTMEQA